MATVFRQLKHSSSGRLKIVAVTSRLRTHAVPPICLYSPAEQ